MTGQNVLCYVWTMGYLSNESYEVGLLEILYNTEKNVKDRISSYTIDVDAFFPYYYMHW